MINLAKAPLHRKINLTKLPLHISINIAKAPTKEELYKAQDELLQAQQKARKETKAGYDFLVGLTPQQQNVFLTEMQSDIEWIKSRWFEFSELLEMLKSNPLTVTRGDFGIHKDIVHVNLYMNGDLSFQLDYEGHEIGEQLLNKIGL